MKTYITISISSLLLFVFILFFSLSRNKSVTDLENDWVIPPVEQNVQERSWRQLEFEKAGISEEFIGSLHMRFGQDGFIYVGDTNRLTVKKFDQEANLLNRFGYGEGSGPGEFLTIIDLMLDPDGRLWVLDTSSNRVTIFNPADEEDWTIMELPEISNRVIPVGNDQYWLEKRFDSQMVRYALSGEMNETMESIVHDPPLWYFVLEGYFALTEERDIIQSHYHTNTLLKYSGDGELLFFREPVLPPGLPDINPYYANDIGRVNTVDFSTWKQTTRNPQVVDDTFQVFVHLRDEDNDEWYPGFMDVYDLADGDYLYSYRLPERLQSVAVSSNYIAGISEELGQLVVWQIEGDH